MECLKLNDKYYPQKLKKITNPPNQIYVEGNIENLNSNCIAVVGSRNCTEYGEKWCKIFVKELVKCGLTIASGMAIGIDCIAHNTALKAGGRTIAVLPSGLNNIYPEQNKYLYEKILKSNGTVITEYSPETTAVSKRFLERNRIITGLSIGTLVVEAAFRSGTSVTAGLAFEQNRDVFCIPGNIENSKSVGTNNLIKAGAKLVTSPEDILENYNFLHQTYIKNRIQIEADDYDIKEEYRNIYKVISKKPIDIDEIVKLSESSLKETMSKLTMLELEGKIKKVSGNRFIRSEN